MLVTDPALTDGLTTACNWLRPLILDYVGIHMTMRNAPKMTNKMLKISIGENLSNFRKKIQLKNNVNNGEVFFKAVTSATCPPAIKARKNISIAVLFPNPPRE